MFFSRRPLRRHFLVGVVALGFLAVVYVALGVSTEFWRDPSFGRKSDGRHWRLSMATGTTALLLVSVALVIGPLCRLRGRSNPTHLPWRRSFGVAAAAMAATHVVFGITIHTEGWRLWVPFTHVWRSSGLLFLLGIALFAGLAAASLMGLLALSSNNWSLRKLGARRWKGLQRSTYLLYGLLAVHIVGVQIQEARDLRHAVLPLTVIVLVVVLQVAGVRATRRNRGMNLLQQSTVESQPSPGSV